ncbi:hypothetical protein I4U23_028728 [Adineta vaga]|nr:hypothetical protein I4U23_028728 [Adineta vaga]
MASMINHLQKALRHHAPMIHFRYGVNHTDTHSTDQTSNQSKNATPSSSSSSSSSTNNQSKKIQTPATLEFSQTPNKYRRRPLTQDEIDLVTVGGFT